jgi:hypothetical protein
MTFQWVEALESKTDEQSAGLRNTPNLSPFFGGGNLRLFNGQKSRKLSRMIAV